MDLSYGDQKGDQREEELKRLLFARELDLKIDDQRPLTGALRFTGTTTFSHGGVSRATTPCMTSATTNEYDIAGDAQQCNLVYLY